MKTYIDYFSKKDLSKKTLTFSYPSFLSRIMPLKDITVKKTASMQRVLAAYLKLKNECEFMDKIIDKTAQDSIISLKGFFSYQDMIDARTLNPQLPLMDRKLNQTYQKMKIKADELNLLILKSIHKDPKKRNFLTTKAIKTTTHRLQWMKMSQ